MITIKPYLPEYKEALIEIFKSNIPLYFAQEELALFDAFLDKDAFEVGPYFIVFSDDVIVGCGATGVAASAGCMPSYGTSPV